MFLKEEIARLESGQKVPLGKTGLSFQFRGGKLNHQVYNTCEKIGMVRHMRCGFSNGISAGGVINAWGDGYIEPFQPKP
ncbi:MAG: hypothetical protein JW816_01225 [Candidatus Buchananbacteria bacterium]|nr:hypothetical protein [Candidatus Buchananbacteria bacterium]